MKGISEVTWIAAGWDIARFALFTVLILWLARGMKPTVLTPGA